VGTALFSAVLSITNGLAEIEDLQRSDRAESQVVAPEPSASQTPEQLDMEAIREMDQKLRAAIAKNHAYLMNIPHVVDVQRSGDSAHPYNGLILVYVDDPYNLSEVERKVPRTIEGFEVRIISGSVHLNLD
jgi:hypothetical protein